MLLLLPGAGPRPRREMNTLRFMERLLRLAVPNTAVWLAMFYLVFHLWLNILGEVLMFGDRMFYKVGALQGLPDDLQQGVSQNISKQ